MEESPAFVRCTQSSGQCLAGLHISDVAEMMDSPGLKGAQWGCQELAKEHVVQPDGKKRNITSGHS